MSAPLPTYYPYRTPHGTLTVGANGCGITRVVFGAEEFFGERRPSELTNRAATELLEYFAGKRTSFDLPLAPEGSAFQHEVWDELVRIPYGQTRSTADIARLLGKPESYRSVGAAVHANPLAILIPSHRIVGANGRPPGVDSAARLRGALLDLERSYAKRG